jgi:hypothetical protein
MAEMFKSSLHDVDITSISLKNIFNTTELFVAASQCKDSEKERLTYRMKQHRGQVLMV